MAPVPSTEFDFAAEQQKAQEELAESSAAGTRSPRLTPPFFNDGSENCTTCRHFDGTGECEREGVEMLVNPLVAPATSWCAYHEDMGVR